MTVHKAAIFFDKDTAGTIYKVDVIEYHGTFWMVPEWLEYPERKERAPARIIALLSVPHQDVPNQQGLPRFLVNAPVSRDVFEGRIPPSKAAGYMVIDRPDIRLPLVGTLN